MDSNITKSDAIRNELLNKPLWQMTGAEFLSLLEGTNSQTPADGEPRPRKLAYGLYELAAVLGCGMSTVNNLRKEGVLDDALYSRAGSKMVFDVDIALRSANDYRKRNNLRRGNLG